VGTSYYYFSVGAGGAAGIPSVTHAETFGQNGDSSWISENYTGPSSALNGFLTSEARALGGGGGASNNQGGQNGRDGGGGGGGGSSYTPGGAWTTYGDGGSGGTGGTGFTAVFDNTSYGFGGPGGGAGVTSPTIGSGGKTSAITGPGPFVFYGAHGGDGGGQNSDNVGSYSDNYGTGVYVAGVSSAGRHGSGSGGAGGYIPVSSGITEQYGANGGSGIVIIKFPYTP
jgi:hypothetical protein